TAEKVRAKPVRLFNHSSTCLSSPKTLEISHRCISSCPGYVWRHPIHYNRPILKRNWKTVCEVLAFSPLWADKMLPKTLVAFNALPGIMPCIADVPLQELSRYSRQNLCNFRRD